MISPDANEWTSPTTRQRAFQAHVEGLASWGMKYVQLNSVQLGSTKACSTKKESLEELRRAVEACRACSLGHLRKQALLGEGPSDAALLIVARSSDSSAEVAAVEGCSPLAGLPGQLLDKILGALQLRREEIYLTNAIKCQVEAAGTARSVAIEACRKHLLQQIFRIQPQAILALGQEAVVALLGTGQDFEALRGNSTQILEIPIIVTYHPHELLLNPQLKALAWQDLQRLHGFLKGAASAEA